MGGDYFVESTQKTSRQVLKEAGVGDKLIDELATAVDRCNYGQSADMLNGLTGILYRKFFSMVDFCGNIKQKYLIKYTCKLPL